MTRVDIRELRQEQLKLAEKVITTDSFEKIKTIAGIDQSHLSDERIISAVVVCDYKTMDVLESKYAVAKPSIPYIPGYLSYREGPVMVEAFSKLENKPDMVLCDCNGILHPRRIGAASHFGILVDVPTIGVAKKLLCGDVQDNKVIFDKEIRAILIKTKEHAKPIIVSPGHRVSLQSAVEIVKSCLRDHKLPEPIHKAHKLANKLKKSMKN